MGVCMVEQSAFGQVAGRTLADVIPARKHMSAGESQQFDAFVRFIETDPVLHKALKGRKWAEFAKLYNGPDYQRNLYDIKLQRAYERHADCGCGQAVAA